MLTVAPVMPRGLDQARRHYRRMLERARAAGLDEDVILWGVAVEMIDRLAERYGATATAALLRQLADLTEHDGRACCG